MEFSARALGHPGACDVGSHQGVRVSAFRVQGFEARRGK